MIIKAAYDSWRREGLIEGALPEFGCISFLRLPQIPTAAFCHWLAMRSGLVVAPGEHFSAPGHIRIGHGQPLERLVKGFDLLTEGLRDYPCTNLNTAVRG